MAEYILRDQAIIAVTGAKLPDVSASGLPIANGKRSVTDCVRRLKEIPAADVRPVITCGKCKYGKYTGTEWFCDKHSVHADKFGEDASYHEYHSKHWFCADGEERKHE